MKTHLLSVVVIVIFAIGCQPNLGNTTPQSSTDGSAPEQSRPNVSSRKAITIGDDIAATRIQLGSVPKVPERAS